MKIWAAYKITCHGMPIYPEFIFRVKHRLERYIEENNPMGEKYTIVSFNLDVPKHGLSNNDFRKQQILEHKSIKEVNITFRGKDGLLVKFTGNEAIDAINKLSTKEKGGSE